MHAEGSLLRVFASGPPEQAALQGVSPESVAAADALLVRLRPARAATSSSARFAGLRAARRSLRHGLDELDARAHRRSRPTSSGLAAAGAEGLALYNLSLVPEAGLEAFRAAAAAFRAAVPA